jgi:hypothetical protein
VSIASIFSVYCGDCSVDISKYELASALSPSLLNALLIDTGFFQLRASGARQIVLVARKQLCQSGVLVFRA